MSSVSILIVDDNQTIRRGIRSLVASQPDWVVCGEAADGLEAVEKAKQLRPDVVLMDISMPRMNGIEATRIIRREVPESQVIIVSQNDPTIGARQASEIGARGYVAKSELARTLLPTISGLIGWGGPDDPNRPGTEKRKRAEEPESSKKPVEPESQAGPDLASASSKEVPAPKLDRTTNLLLRNAPELQRAERASNLLAAIVNSADDAIISKSLDGMITSWNKSAEEMFGYRPEEAIGQHITLIIPPDRRNEEVKIIEQLKRGERVDHFETVRMRKDGTLFDVSLTISPVRDADGTIIGASKIARDISERKQAQRGSWLLAAVVDSSGDAIISKSLEGVITSWNKGAELMFGYTAEEAMGKPITLIVPADRQEEEVRIMQRLREGKRVEHFETVRMRNDGTLLDVSVVVSPVRDGVGRLIGASKVARDITERKRVDRALRESEEKLRALADGLETQVHMRTQQLEVRNAEVVAQSALLRELSNRLLRSQDDERRRIARELHDSAGQVLTALGISLSSLRQHTLQNPELANDLQEAEDTLQVLNREIRTMSYLLHPPLLDENGLLEAVRWYINGLSERSGLQIELSASETVGRLPSEIELALFRTVQECLTNIHRHSGSKRAKIRLSCQNGEVSLEIQDEGKGIPAARLANIQAQRSGVGLSGIRERVRHLHGIVTIASDERGTMISVTIPVSKSATPVVEEIDEPTRAVG